MRLSHAAQYGTPAVIVELADSDPELVIRTARAHGAISYAEGDETFVIDFQDMNGRRVGPALYTESALRRTLVDLERLAERSGT